MVCLFCANASIHTLGRASTPKQKAYTYTYTYTHKRTHAHTHTTHHTSHTTHHTPHTTHHTPHTTHHTPHTTHHTPHSHTTHYTHTRPHTHEYIDTIHPLFLVQDNNGERVNTIDITVMTQHTTLQCDMSGSIVSFIPTRLIHELSKERQPLHCDVIVGKQYFFKIKLDRVSCTNYFMSIHAYFSM